MIGLLLFVLAILASPFRSTAQLQAENAALRHQLVVLRRKYRGKIRLTNGDRLFFVQLYRWFPSIRSVVHILRPETLVRWHRAGFRSYWRWKSRNRGGRPQIDADLRALIGQMNLENPLWGAPRIHGELLKLGFEVSQSTVAKYMKRHVGPPGQSWWTSAQSHARNRGDGPVRGAGPCLQPALRLHHRSARPSRARLDCRDEQPDGGLDCTSDYRGVSLGVSAKGPDPRPRPRLRFRREAAPPRNGHSG